MSSTDFLFVLVLAGSLQGVITGCLLYYLQPYRLSNRLLAVSVWLIALPGIHLFAHHAGFFGYPPLTDWIHASVPWVLLMALGPTIYFYLKSAIETDYHRRSIHALHFAPIIIDLLPKMVELLFLMGLLPLAFVADRTSLIRFTAIYNQYADLPRWFSLACYVLLCDRYLQQRRLYCKAGVDGTAIEKWTVSFIRIMKLLVLIWLLYLIPYLLPATSVLLQQSVGWFPVYLPLATLIYWIGITGYRMALTIPNHIKSNTTAMPLTGYSTETMEQAAGLLKERMKTDKLFLNPALDLSGLAKLTGVPAKLISATVNQYLNSSFSQFVNEFRVAEFQQRVVLPDAEHLTLAGLADACGFSSQATFQRVFKQLTGFTPAGYRKKALSAS